MLAYAVEEGVARITWDMRERPMNVLDHDSMAAFDTLVDRALADASIGGVIVDSARSDFIAGADLQMLSGLRDVDEVLDLCRRLGALFRKMETGGKPFVAAINGHALGGGLELALACHRRIAADEPRARIGLPEVTLGLLPGGGGTQRLPRMIGIDKALPLLLEGWRLPPRAALELGVVDQVVPPEELRAAARRWIEEEGNPEKAWYDESFRPPGPPVQSPRGYEIFVAGNALLHGRTRGNYPAPRAIMSCVYEGLQVPLETGLGIESRYFAKLCTCRETRAMIRSLFFSINEAKKLGRRPAGVPPARYRRIGVLGAGMMGAGIAYASALAGLEVVLLDTSAELAGKGKAWGAGVMEGQIARGRMSEAQRDRTLARIVPTTDFADLRGCDLVIEAVFEDREVKAEVCARAEAVLGGGAIYASNTSTLPITGLAGASARPARFIGLHFFSPVDRMQLVEVILGEKTSGECLARALDYVQRIGRVPIVVRDSRGFYTSRVVSRFLDEGMALLEEGVPPALIENGGKLAGFPVGPLALGDEVSLQLIHAIREQQRRDLGEAGEAKPGDGVLRRLVGELGRLGRKSGGGFYDYPKEGPKRLWPGLRTLCPPREPRPEVEEVKKRMLFVQSVDAARCLEEGVLSDPRDGDVGSLLGWGFPAWTGGAISFVDYVGAGAFVEECERLHAAHGERFAPPRSLRKMAASGGAFYPDCTPRAGGVRSSAPATCRRAPRAGRGGC